jgi:hypothetical protein
MNAVRMRVPYDRDYMHVQFLNNCIIYYVKPNKKFREREIVS